MDLASIKRTMESAEAGILDTVAAIVPWLAPTPTAYIAYDHLLNVLRLPDWVSLAGALVVEGLGLSVIHTALGFWRADGLRSWRLWLAIGAGVFYLTVVTAVNVLLDRGVPVETLAKSLLSFTSIPAALILALRAQDKQAALRRRVEADRVSAESERAAAQEIERVAWEREQEARRRAAELAERQTRLQLDHELRLARLQLRATGSAVALRATQQGAPGGSDALRATAGDASVAPGASKHDATLQAFVADNPSATPSQIERATGINRGTVSRWLRRNAPLQAEVAAASIAPAVVLHPNGA